MSPIHNFNVEIADASGAVCVQPVEINVEPGCGAADWIGDPAILCRLRIPAYVDGMFPIAAPCAACPAPPPPLVPWDGTFTVRTAPAPPVTPLYSNAAAFNCINGRSTTGGNINVAYDSGLGKWWLRLSCSVGDFWQGYSPVTLNPIATYTPTFDFFLIGNITLEGYLPP